MIFGVGLGSCKSYAPQIHIADLPKSALPASETILLKSQDEYGSTDSKHEIIPPHGQERPLVQARFPINNRCASRGIFEFCFQRPFFGTQFQILVKDQGKLLDALDFDRVSNLFPPAPQIYQIIEFKSDTLGVLHSFGFTLFRGTQFCKTIDLNRNHRLSFGVSRNTDSIFIASSGSGVESVDRPSDGWRSYPIESFCR
jgi:hypothetical protein